MNKRNNNMKRNNNIRKKYNKETVNKLMFLLLDYFTQLIFI